MTNSKEQHTVVNGPSRWDLSVALFDRSSVNCRKVFFVTEPPLSLGFEVQVTSIQAEDGSGESWNIEGYATMIGTSEGPEKNSSVPSPSLRVFIYFRTDRRKGYVKFLN